MRTYILLFSLLLFTLGQLSAQKKSGIIQFEEKIDMHRNLPPDAGDMRAMIPKYRTSKSELLFSAKESLYRNVEEDDEDEDMGGGSVRIRMQRPQSIYYKNFTTGKRTDQREFMGKRYLIQDDISQTPWKVGTTTKQILGYTCMEAVWEDTTGGRERHTVAWFTPDLAISSGPMGYGQLPGMILAVEINKGEIQLTATKVDLKTLSKGTIKAPKKGEKTTQEGFQKVVDERIRAMGGQGGRGVRVIRN